jgi:hypothetical protein
MVGVQNGTPVNAFIHQYNLMGEFEDYQRIVAVRNPYSRVVSLCKWRKGRFPDSAFHYPPVSIFLKENVYRLSFVVKLEDITQSLIQIYLSISSPSLTNLITYPTFNEDGNSFASGGNHWKDYYVENPSAIKKVQQVYSSDFEIFNYSKELDL